MVNRNAIINFFRSKYPEVDLHELNIDSWILLVMKHEIRIDDLEEWKAQHIEEYNALKTKVDGFDGRIENLETAVGSLEDWKTTHEAAYESLAGTVGLLSGRMTSAEYHIGQLGQDVNATRLNLSQAINDSIQRDTQLNQKLIDLIAQAGGADFIVMNENIIAYAQEFRYIDELSAMYDNSINSNAWYVFEDESKFTANGFETSTDCYIYLGALSAIEFPLTLSIKRGGSVFSGQFVNSSTQPVINGITCSIVSNSKGAWLKLDTNAGNNITGLKLENGLVATPFNTNTFSEYLKIFRNIVKDVIDESIYNTDRITIDNLDCNLYVFDRATYPDDPTITNIGTATINFQIVNSVVMGQVTVIGDPTLVIDANDLTKVYQIRIEGDGIEDLPVSSLQTNVSWERTLIGSSAIRMPGGINAFYEHLTNNNTEVDYLVGNVSGIIPAKGFDTTILSFGISCPLPGNIASLDNTEF